MPLLQSGPALADTAPVPPVTQTTVSADALPTVQIDGVAWAQVVVGNRVYVTGKFSQARRPDRRPGRTRRHARTSSPTTSPRGRSISSWAPSLNAQGLAIAASTDGTRIYVAGDFTSVSGVARSRIVALDATTGAVAHRLQRLGEQPGARPGGGGQHRVRRRGLHDGRRPAPSAARRLQRHRRAPSCAWAPTVDQAVLALTAVPAANEVIAGGRFITMNGASTIGMGAIDATTGASLPWAVNQVVKDYGADAAIYSSGERRQPGVRAPATATSSTTTRRPTPTSRTWSPPRPTAATCVWVSGCRGDTYSVGSFAGTVYNVGHAHDCSAVGGWPQTEPVRPTSGRWPTPRRRRPTVASTTAAPSPAGPLPSCSSGTRRSPPERRRARARRRGASAATTATSSSAASSRA